MHPGVTHHAIYIAIILLLILVIAYLLARTERARTLLHEAEIRDSQDPIRVARPRAIPIAPGVSPSDLLGIALGKMADADELRQARIGAAIQPMAVFDDLVQTRKGTKGPSVDVSEAMAVVGLNGYLSEILDGQDSTAPDARNPGAERVAVDIFAEGLRCLGRQVDASRARRLNSGIVHAIAGFLTAEAGEAYKIAVVLAWWLSDGPSTEFSLAETLGEEVETVFRMRRRRAEYVDSLGPTTYENELRRHVNSANVLLNRLDLDTPGLRGRFGEEQ